MHELCNQQRMKPPIAQNRSKHYKLQITSKLSIVPPTEWMGALNNESYAYG